VDKVARNRHGGVGGSGVCTFRVGSVRQLEERGWTEGRAVICPLSRVPHQPPSPSADSDGRRAISGLAAVPSVVVRDSDPAAWEPWMAPLDCMCAMFPGDSRGSLQVATPPPPVVVDLWGLIQSCRPPLDSIRLGIRNPAAQRSRGGHMTSKLFLVLLTCRAPGVIGFEVHRACRLAGLLRKMYLCTLALAPSTTVLYTVHGR
jgi:hypothetical protein